MLLSGTGVDLAVDLLGVRVGGVEDFTGVERMVDVPAVEETRKFTTIMHTFIYLTFSTITTFYICPTTTALFVLGR